MSQVSFLSCVVALVLWSLNTFIKVIYIPYIFLQSFKTGRKCPPIQDKLLLRTAEQLAESIRKQEITSLEVLETYIRRIKEVNPILNAVIVDCFPKALEEAKKVDLLLQITSLSSDELKTKYPLFGVPITIKGSLAVKGFLHSSGRVDRTLIADTDSDVVGAVKAAGAIPLVLSNVPELCMNWETKNKLIGRTNNPYDTNRTPGGSSGGEASLLTSGGSIIGIGSDICGSLRLPAHFCGIWGHKPSPFAVSCRGHYPDCGNKEIWDRIFTLGPMARYATDLSLLLKVLVKPSYQTKLLLNQKVDVKNIKVFYMESIKSYLFDDVDPSVTKALQKVLAHFDGASLEPCQKLLKVKKIECLFDENDTKGPYIEFLKVLCGASKHEIPAVLLNILQDIVKQLPEKSNTFVNNNVDKLRTKLCSVLGENGVLILPTVPFVASYHNEDFRRVFNYGLLAIFNILGFPVTNCPVLINDEGHPIGLQVVAAPNMDRLTLAIAVEIEKIFGGWKFE